jgi:hypothetical protein
MIQLQTPKIEIYRTRTFSDKLTDTFNFLRENWRPLLKYFIYIMLPVSIVMAFFVNHFWNGYISLIMMLENIGSGLDFGTLSFALSTIGVIIVSLIAYAILAGLTFCLIRLYDKRPQRLKDLTFDEMKPELMYCMKRSAVLIVVSVLLVIAAVIVLLIPVGLAFWINGVLGFLSIVLLYIILIVLVIPLTLVTPIYLMEDQIGVIPAFAKAFRLGFATWGGIFAVMFIVGIITSVLQTFTMMPWYILSMIKMALSISDNLEGSFFNTFFFTFLQYLTCILQCLGYLLAELMTLVALTIQYGHACDKIDGVGVAQKIVHFEEFDNF